MASVTLLKATSKAALSLSFNLLQPHKSSGTNSKANRALKISEAAAVTWYHWFISDSFLRRISTKQTSLTFKNLEFWSSNSRISSSIFLILASAVTFSSCSFCLAPSSSSSCSSRSWQERQFACLYFPGYPYVNIFLLLLSGKNTLFWKKSKQLPQIKLKKKKYFHFVRFSYKQSASW